MIATIAAGALLRLFSIQDGLSGFGNVRLADSRGVPLRARDGRHPAGGTHRLRHREARRQQSARPGVFDRPRGSGDGADDASNTARAGGILFPITLTSRGCSIRARSDRVAHRQLFAARALSRRSRGVGDVPDGVRAQSAGRRHRPSGICGAAVVDDVGGRRVGPGVVALAAIPYLVYRLFRRSISTPESPGQVLPVLRDSHAA